jgi:exodeoxyribonuclease VII large subunit
VDKTVLSVSELNDYIKTLIDCDNMLGAVYVRGELSNYKIYPSGHHYFTMKDAEGALKCVMFRSSASKLRFRPENGMKVVAFGRVSVYQRDGVYQLYVNALTADGVGDLYIAFEQLKEKLLKEGLFDERFKKPLPRFPKRIAVITSGAGAAVRDIIRVLGARWPMAKVIILPVRVQGVEAPAEIAGAIAYANRHKVADLIITGRGGGSIEDLWAFNEERVARAIFASEMPVISAVGHEPDVTISDFVADVRAATPSNAAEIAVPDRGEMLEALLSYEIRAMQALRRELTAHRRRLNDLASRRVLVSPKNYLDDKRLLLDHAHSRMCAAAERILAERKHKFAAQAAALDAMSPLKVLGRGYAIARREDGAVIKSAADVKPGDKITVRLQKDAFAATVDGAEPI